MTVQKIVLTREILADIEYRRDRILQSFEHSSFDPGQRLFLATALATEIEHLRQEIENTP